MPKPGVITAPIWPDFRSVRGATPTGDGARTRAVTPGCRSTIGPPPVGLTHPEPLPACAAAGLVRTRSVDPSGLDGYLREICQQGWLALLASMQLRDLLQLGEERPSRLRRPDASRVWDLQCWEAVQTILSCRTALSGLLWPDADSPGSLVRGAALRRALRVDDHSPLRESAMGYRTPDYHDALDQWLATHWEPDMGFGVSPVGGRQREEPVAARWMDPDTWVVRMFGTEIDLSGIVEEASRLAAAATDLGSRWPLASVRSAW